MAVLLAGLSPRLPPALNPDDADALPTTDRLTTRANRADAWLTSLLAAFAASATIGAIGTAVATHGIHRSSMGGTALPPSPVRCCCYGARSADTRRSLVFAICGITTVATAFTVAADRALEHGPWIAALTAMLAAVAMFLGFVAPRCRFARHVPHHRIAGVSGADRNGSIDRLCGAYSARHLDLTWT
ncbi:hypothetical protein ACQKB0_18425 [Mycobacterium tuberculosis]